jgi:hypothetical protein
MLRFAREVYGRDVLEEAWAEFVVWDDEDPGFDPESIHVPVFMPWFFHRWGPDPAGTGVLEAAPGVVIPPDEKLAIIDLRDRIAERAQPITRQTLADWEVELREEYLACVDAIMDPTPPRLENTDGDPLEFHRLSFEIPSAPEAFDALKHLALAGRHAEADAEAELLESAELDDEGRPRRVSFPWQAAGNPVHAHWDNTILGHIEIHDDRLVAEVNSAGRDQCPPGGAGRQSSPDRRSCQSGGVGAALAECW